MITFQATAISKSFGGVQALQNASMSADKGQIVGILGPNGSGKTTFFNMVTGFGSPTSGSFVFEGCDITGWKSFRIAQAGVIRTFQNLRLFRDMTCIDNVLVGAHRLGSGSLIQGMLLPRGERARERDHLKATHELLAQVGLYDRRSNYAANLSYGQMKRLEIARAMAAHPRLLLLDEPAAGINDTQARDVLGLVQRLAGERDITVIIIEHNVRALLEIATDIFVLDAGQVVFHGPPNQVRNSPEVIEAYLGEEA